MNSASCNVAKDFEAGLDIVYGKFSSRETSARSRYEISCNEAHFLRPVRIVSQCLVTNRQANGLNREWDDHFFIMQQVSGQMRVASHVSTHSLRANDMVLLDSCSAYEYLNARSSETVLVPFHFDFVESRRNLLASCGQRIDGSAGVGKVLATTLSSLINVGEIQCEADRRAMLDAVRVLLSRVLEQVPAEAPRESNGLLAMAEQIVLRDLADPALSPDGIADAINLSRRQLYRLFAELGTTPSSWLWRMRLAEAHARLLSSAWRSASLTQIAFDVGFNDMAHFSRLYRAEFGISPREMRRRHARPAESCAAQ